MLPWPSMRRASLGALLEEGVTDMPCNAVAQVASTGRWRWGGHEEEKRQTGNEHGVRVRGDRVCRIATQAGCSGRVARDKPEKQRGHRTYSVAGGGVLLDGDHELAGLLALGLGRHVGSAEGGIRRV